MLGTVFFTKSRTTQLVTNIPFRLVILPCLYSLLRRIGSSGVFVRRNLPKGKYSLRIVASDPLTREKAILRGEYFIPSLSATREDPHCGATVVNMSSETKNGRFEIEFRGTPHVGSFMCRTDRGTNEPCEPLSCIAHII